MWSSLVKVLLLGGFVCWASGIDGWAHERLEHCHDEQVVATAKDGSAGAPRHPADDHDDCQICQMLKLMKVEPASGIGMPIVVRPVVGVVQVTDHVGPKLAVVVFLPARGPPAR